jgi:hypothetical protein
LCPQVGPGIFELPYKLGTKFLYNDYWIVAVGECQALDHSSCRSLPYKLSGSHTPQTSVLVPLMLLLSPLMYPLHTTRQS